MSTTPMESFAVDLATLGPIYPFVGTEKLLVLVGAGDLDRPSTSGRCASRTGNTRPSCTS